MPIAWYLAAAAAVSAVSALAARETKGIDLADIDLADSGVRPITTTRSIRHPDGPEPTELVEGAI